jgi:hypothetical protein
MTAGKGFYIWQIPNVEGGDINAISSLAQTAKLSHVLIKIADGTSAYNLDAQGRDLVSPLVSLLKAKGIESWGWHYVYGNQPSLEAQIAIQRIQETGVAGYMIDAEAEYKEPGKQVAASTFMSALRASLPVYPVGLSSYRYPSLHPELPWQEFLGKCDLAMPQVYWILAHDPGDQLDRCLNEYRAMTTLPIIPTGAAFSESGWTPTSAEVIEFMDQARANFLSAVNFWEWSAARKLPSIWEAITNYIWPIAEPPPPASPPIVRARVWANSLYVRSGPGSESQVVGSLKLGTRVTIFDLDRAWVKISPDEERWVYSLYLEKLD